MLQELRALENKFKELLIEIGTLDTANIFPYITDFNNSFIKTASAVGFVDSKEISLRVEFYDWTKDEISEMCSVALNKLTNVVNLGFTINGDESQALQTNYAYLLKIYSTIYAITLKYINRFNPEAITIGSIDKHGRDIEDRQKLNIYKLFAKKNLPPNYYISSLLYENNHYIVLHRKS